MSEQMEEGRKVWFEVFEGELQNGDQLSDREREIAHGAYEDGWGDAIASLRAQLASATATIAEHTQRADAAEGREAGLRSALERAVFDCNCTGGYWEHMMSDGRVYTVTCKRCGPMRAALATPTNGASEVT